MYPLHHSSFPAQESPFVKIGDAVLGVNIPQVLKGVNSPEQLISLLQTAQKYQELQDSFGAESLSVLIEKAERARQLQADLDAAKSCIQAQDELIAKQRTLIDILESGGDEVFIAPSFPQDFEFYGNVGELSDEEIQDIVITTAAVELAEGEYTYISSGGVIRMHDGDKIVTVVAKDFYEATEDTLESLGITQGMFDTIS